MPVYSHRSLDANGNVISGRITATSVAAATESLLSEDLTPADLVLGDAGFWMKLNAPVDFFGQPDKRDVYAFTRDLARLTRAGLTLERALELTAQTAENKIFATMIIDIQKAVRKGESLASALAIQKQHFPVFFIAAVHAGEAAGSLPFALKQLDEMIARQLDFTDRVRSALIYPCILLFMVVITLVIVVTIVLPQFAPLFEGAEDRLPWITRTVMKFGELMRDFGSFLVIIIMASVPGIVYLFRQTDTRKWLAAKLVRIWLFVMPDLIRVTRTLGGAIMGGVQLDSALPMAAATALNIVIRKDFETIAENVKKGRFLSAELAQKLWVPPSLLQMIRVGEETGSLGPMLQEAASLMEDYYRLKLEKFLNLLSPLLTLVMGGIVATLIAAVLIGMMSINDVVF